jgi:hypothetical protein
MQLSTRTKAPYGAATGLAGRVRPNGAQLLASLSRHWMARTLR